jgi:large subunit ribosomal protein L10
VKRDQKAAVIDRVAGEIQEADAVLAIDYRGLSVKQAVDLRISLREANASFRIVKNTLTERAADKAGAESLKALLEGPTALTFVHGDIALAAKAISQFRRQAGILEFKGGQMDGETLTVDQIEAIAKLPARDVLHGQLVGTIASPLTGLVRGLASMISGLASQLQQVADKGLVGSGAAGENTEAQAAGEQAAGEQAAGEQAAGSELEEPAAEPEAAAPEESPAEQEEPEPSEAPGDPVAEAEAAEEDTTETPSEGDTTETEEG